MNEENQTPEETTEEVEQEGTEAEETVENPTESEVDYKKKFSESTREAQRLLEEKKKAEEELESLRSMYENNSDTNYGNESVTNEPLYDGFEDLSEEEQERLINYTNSIRNKIQEDLYKDPSISFAKESYNENLWDKAFDKISSQYPQLKESKDQFKSKYFQKNNVPDNIEDILGTVAKSFLFDKAKDLGRQEAEEQSNRIDIERSSGGDKTSPQSTSRSLEDWKRLADENPGKFAALSEEYKKDLETGKLK